MRKGSDGGFLCDGRAPVSVWQRCAGPAGCVRRGQRVIIHRISMLLLWNLLQFHVSRTLGIGSHIYTAFCRLRQSLAPEYFIQLVKKGALYAAVAIRAVILLGVIVRLLEVLPPDAGLFRRTDETGCFELISDFSEQVTVSCFSSINEIKDVQFFELR